MKKKLLLLIALGVVNSCILPAYAASSQIAPMRRGTKSALIVLIVISAAMILFSLLFTFLGKGGRKKGSGNSFQKVILPLLYITTVIVIGFTGFSYVQYRNFSAIPEPQAQTTEPQITETAAEETQPLSTDASIAPETEAETQPAEPTFPSITPQKTADTDPENWGVIWEIIDRGSIVPKYERAEPITFGAPEEYYPFPGISTFRGNNYRNAPVYGTADVKEGKFSQVWNRNIGSLNGWPGSGWTGQPLIAQWDEETKAIMNMYDNKKAKKDLVEVIYATLDGNVYFYDLEDGSYTRDPITLGMNFKGAGSLDPRGYPILYVGSGDYINGTAPRMYIVSLVDGSILYKKSGADAFAQRDWVAFDSSPLVDAETDTLIWPGESGILYTIKLNTNYDKAAGTLSIAPEETVKSRYTTKRYTPNKYWIGFEPSAVVVDHYLYVSENGGMFFCIDLNTMMPVWAQDTKDDSNSTPVFEWGANGDGYIYTAPSLHWSATRNSSTTGTGTISIYKLNAKTGEIVWEVPFDCHTVEGVSGGVQSTPLLGKKGTELEGLILYTIARTPNLDSGKLVAFDTSNGNIVWEKSMSSYAWSSPIALYNEDGTAHIVVCDSAGNMMLYNSKGDELETINLGSNIEATPTAFNDMIIVGTRGQRICGIKLK